MHDPAVCAGWQLVTTPSLAAMIGLLLGGLRFADHLNPCGGGDGGGVLLRARVLWQVGEGKGGGAWRDKCREGGGGGRREGYLA